MKKFFIPMAEDDAQAERVLEATAEHCSFPIPKPEARIFRIDYQHNGQSMTASVGGQPDQYYREVGPVIAILRKPGLYCICLPLRGVESGSPIYVGENSVTSAVYFDS